MAVRKQKRNENEPNEMTTRRTVILMFLSGIVAFIVLIVQLGSIMIGQHDFYESRAVEDQVRSTTVNASRGTIYDNKMLILAQSATVETVYISPYEMVRYGEDKEAIAAALSRILDVDYDSIMEKWEDTDSWYKTIRIKVEQDLANEVRAYVNGGFLSDPNYRYKDGESAKGATCAASTSSRTPSAITPTAAWAASSSASWARTTLAWTASRPCTTRPWREKTGASSAPPPPTARICSSPAMRNTTTPRTATASS